jgi:protein SCO1/2
MQILRSVRNDKFFEKPLKQKLTLLMVAAISSLVLLVACNSSPKTASAERTQYPLKGKVLSIDKPNASMVVDGEKIPGFMEAMAMPYRVKNANDLDAVAVGDSIAANIVKENDDYFVADVKVMQHSAAPASKPTAELHIPQTGESVPNFELVNQSGRHVSLEQYRGKTLLLTFIYTRCPFADFCPRVTGEFAALNQELRKDAKLYGKTHLLSVSFDPKHDSPKVLRTYGAGYMGKPARFDHWEFAVAPEDELPDIARYFGLTYTEDGGLITHTLSTAVIGPDGKILKWYHGSDWKAADLLKDVQDAGRADAKS